MKMLDRILVPVDFGPATDGVVGTALGLAQSFGARLQLVYVIEEVPHFAGGLGLLKDAAADRLNKLQDTLVGSRVPCDPGMVETGRSFDCIVRMAESTNSHLIVMGRGGLRDKSATGLGTTTARVMRRTAKPVLAVAALAPISRILCPVDGSNPSARGLRNAILLARILGARLTVMTTIGHLSPHDALARQPGMAKLASDYQKMERDQFEQFVKSFDFGSIAWDKEVRYGHPPDEIVQLAVEAKYDLVVMGSTGRSGVPRILLGSTAETVARRVNCSILTVKRDDVLSVSLETELRDIHRFMSEGQSLLDQGHYEEAIARFDQCLLKDPYLATAIEGQATAHHELGHREIAADLREQAALIRRDLWRDQPEPREALTTN